MAPALMFLVIVGAITAALLVFDLLALAFGVDSRDAWRR